MLTCPHCGHLNRSGAKFCGACATPLAAVAVQPVPPGAAAPQVAAPAVAPAAPASNAPAGPPPAPAPAPAASVGPKLAQAAAAAAPAARQAASAGWTGSKKAVGAFAWMVTRGGRAAYTELVDPAPTAEGRVAGAPSERTVVAPLEPAVLVFIAVCLLGWLVFALPAWLGATVLGAVLLVLLVLSYVGVRRPYFRASAAALVERLAHGGRGSNVPMLRFDLLVPGQSQPVQVVMVGPWTPVGGGVNPGETVRVRGMSEPSRNELHAWQIHRLDAGGGVIATLAAPRLLPLTVALFAPVIIMLVVRLLTLRA